MTVAECVQSSDALPRASPGMGVGVGCGSAGVRRTGGRRAGHRAPRPCNSLLTKVLRSSRPEFSPRRGSEASPALPGGGGGGGGALPARASVRRGEEATAAPPRGPPPPTGTSSPARRKHAAEMPPPPPAPARGLRRVLGNATVGRGGGREAHVHAAEPAVPPAASWASWPRRTPRKGRGTAGRGVPGSV